MKPSPSPATGAPTPIVIDGVASRFEFDTPRRMCDSVLVADATISVIGRSHWNTIDGSRSAAVDQQTVAKGYQIVTPLQFSRIAILIDRRHAPTSEFASMGGTVGQDQYWMHGFPQLTAGQRYLIVFSPGLAAGARITQTLLLAYNAFPIDDQQVVLLKTKQVEQGHVSQEEVRLPLSQILQQLGSCPRNA